MVAVLAREIVTPSLTQIAESGAVGRAGGSAGLGVANAGCAIRERVLRSAAPRSRVQRNMFGDPGAGTASGPVVRLASASVEEPAVSANLGAFEHAGEVVLDELTSGELSSTADTDLVEDRP